MEALSEALIAQQQVIRLQALLETSRQLHSTIELDEVVHMALEIVVRELELDGAFFTSFHQVYGEVPQELQIWASGSADEAQPVPPEWPAFLRFPLHDKGGTAFTELIVVLPQDRTLDLDETDFLESLAVQAAVAIENARFHQRALQWQRVESDLAAARLVQLSLIPQQMPTIPNYRIGARSVACYEVGGDYLDIVPIESGDTVIVVADVAGKGLASALIGASFRSALRAMIHAGLPLQQIATQLNLLHFNEGEEARHRYVTAVFMRLNPAGHRLEIVNAGHTPIALQRSTAELVRFKASGTPIGLLPFSSYVAEEVDFLPGDKLLAYTDGLTEVFCGEEEFGEPRLLEAFAACTEPVPGSVLDTLWRTLETFSSGSEQSDDMTALVLSRDAAEPAKSSIELQLPSRLGCEKIAMGAAADLARQMGFGEDRIEDLKTAVAEACINAMEHGNKLDETLPIGVMLSMDRNSLEVKVRDSGTGPPTTHVAPDIDRKMQEEENPRGMGMFLIESLMDEVEWIRSPHDGSYARMVIRLRPDDENVKLE